MPVKPEAFFRKYQGKDVPMNELLAHLDEHWQNNLEFLPAEYGPDDIWSLAMANNWLGVVPGGTDANPRIHVDVPQLRDVTVELQKAANIESKAATDAESEDDFYFEGRS